MKQSITVLDAANQPTGPFSIQEVRQKLDSGEFKAAQLAHTEGLGAWTPLSDVLAYLDKQNPPAAAVSTPAPSAFQPAPTQAPVTQAPISTVTSQPSFSTQPTTTSSQPSFATPTSQPSFAAPSSQPSFSSPQPNYAVTATPGALSTAPVGFRPAEFWKRLVAYIVDILVITIIALIPLLIIGYAFCAPANNGDPNPLYIVGVILVNIIIVFISALYFGIASFGKMIFGLKVVDAQGNAISMGHSFLRGFVKAILCTTPLCCLGFVISIASLITALVTADGKSLHDLIVGTSVIEPIQP